MAVNMFLKLDGVDGESQQKGHEQWIEIESFSWGVTNVGSAAAGGGAGAGKTSMQDFHFTKQTDTASPKLFLRCASGQHIKWGQLSLVKAGSELSRVESETEYLKIKLTEILVSSLQQSGGGDTPQDAFSLNFAKIEFTVLSETAAWGPQQYK